jgi:hypothetical protein
LGAGDGTHWLVPPQGDPGRTSAKVNSDPELLAASLDALAGNVDA